MAFYLLLMVPVILLSLWAQTRVKSTFQRYARVPSRRGLTGADVARLLLRARGLHDVKVEATRGFLSDHYDPTTRTLRLSEATHDSHSVAAIGVAAHEAGHAIQHAEHYAPLRFRSAVVPVVSIGSRALPWLMMFAIFSGAFRTGGPIAWLAVAALAVVAVFSIATLPVEFDASRRALLVLEHGAILDPEELTGARKVLDAAAWTYIAAAVAAVVELLFWLLPLILGSRGNED